VDSDQTAVHLRPRQTQPSPPDGARPPQPSVQERLRAELSVRVRLGGGLLIGSALLAAPLLWTRWPLLAVMGAVGAAAAILPESARTRLAEPLAVLLSITALGASLGLQADATFALPLLVTLLTSLLLPTRSLVSGLTLLVQGAMILLLAMPGLLELPLLAAGLGAAFWLTHVQVAHWQTLFKERADLACATSQLEQQAARQELMLTRREQELLEQQDKMVKQEKWATLGRVATGVAHEIKNPLQAAFVDLDTARQTGDTSLLEDVEVSLRRIENIVRDVSRLRGNDTFDVAAYDLKPLLRASLRSARMGLQNLRVMEGAVPPVVVSCNQSLLIEILANLLTNAAHAMERRGGGRVKVHAALTAHRVLVYIDDDGPGIPKGAEDRIFEAFITTKPSGKGTGLGLPISRSKLQAMGGDLWAEQGSDLGGARLVVALAYAPSDADRAKVRSPSPAPARRQNPADSPTRTVVSDTDTSPRQHGTLLLIDDDRSVRRALSRTLSRSWRVLLASGSKEARALARREPVDVVLCDMHLLQEDAVDVLLALERIDRTLPSKTVFMSGEPTSSRLLALAEGNPERMIGKPFDPSAASARLLLAKQGQLPMLERVEDVPTPPSIGALEPVWSFEAPTEEVTFDE